MSDERERKRRRSIARLRDALARTARIARWEISRSTGTVDRKSALVLVGLLLAVGVVGLSVADEGLGLEDELYVIAVDEDSQYHDVAVESDSFRVIGIEDLEIDDGGADANADVVITRRGRIGHVGPNGEAAYDAFRDAVERYNERRLSREANRTAAYPVLVDLEYRDRDLGDSGESTAGDDGTGSGSDDVEPDGDAAGGGDDSSDGESTTDGIGDGADDTGDGSGTDTDDARGDEAGGANDGTGGTGDGSLRVPDVASGAIEDSSGTPGSISPPFPFQSLLLAFLFVVPMNFVIQAYGSTIMDERVKRRGELLLVSPASSREIVAGKTLPYLAGLVAIAVSITLAVGGGPLSVAAAVPIALLFLAATFAGAMLARSYKELTFVTVTISVFLTTYTFIPAVFTDITPIALISPLTLIVMDLQGESARLGEYLFSTGPFLASAGVCFLLGLGVYREEDMFAQKAIPVKVIDAVASRLRGYRSVPILSTLFIPFVFTAQLLAVALLFAVPETIALPVIIVLAAAIEEFAKSIHVYAGFARSKFESSLRVAVLVGALSGLGFFVGEKFTHVAQFVGLPELTVGVAAFGPALSSDPVILVALFLAPLVLHVVTAVISALGASRGENQYAVAFVIATLVHAAYNLGVIALVA
ncbi:PrsW family intramembrane metalloprotease [Natronorubrum sp. FCH18a]|uniref:PrsW family intramembrane metalloprotease n=1 Tax=Natronorubrum sp. FCH18a TaxID=3447018 RepID=UPI003F51A27B